MSIYYVYMTPAGDIMGLKFVSEYDKKANYNWLMKGSIEKCGVYKPNSYEVYLDMNSTFDELSDMDKDYYSDLRSLVMQMVREDVINRLNI